MLPSNYQDLVDEDETEVSVPVESEILASSDSLGSTGSQNLNESYLINQNTKVTFLARRYRLAFILDLSPSMTAVDTQSNKVQFEEIFTALSRSLRGLAQPVSIYFILLTFNF